MNLFEICLHSRTGLFVLLLSVHHHNQQPFTQFDCFQRYTATRETVRPTGLRKYCMPVSIYLSSLPFGLEVQQAL